MNTKQQLAVMELSITKKYIQALIAFIEDYPALEEQIKASLAAKNYHNCSESLTALCVRLEKIHADDLAAEALRQAGQFKKMQHDKIESYIIDFLAGASALSISIQMALHSPDTINDTAAAPDAEKGVILAVDDVSFFLSRLKSIVDETPYKLVCVNSGAAALRYLKKQTPALFLLDIEMPEMDGYELARKIKESGNTSPVVFMTGNASAECVTKAIQVGAVDFIVKPVDRNLVIEKINKFMKAKP